MVTIGEAKMMILAHWREWAGERAPIGTHTASDAEAFVRHLQIDHPHMLAFESDIKKLELIETWLVDARLIY